MNRLFRKLRFAHRVWLMPGLAAAGLLLILAAPGMAKRVGERLTSELDSR